MVLRMKYIAHREDGFRCFSRCSYLWQIGTHSGVFHCDEALACYMLKLLPQFKDATIVRTRDEETLKECDIVVDVGSVFDHALKRYDHHQRGFTHTLSSLRPDLGDKFNIKLSSAGLVYTYFGEEVLKQLVPDTIKQSPKNLQNLFKKIYESFIQEVDAIDNGVTMFDGEPKYNIHTHLSSRVGRLNPKWNQVVTETQDELFKKAMLLAGEELHDFVNYYVTSWFPGRAIVMDSIDKRFATHESGAIVEFKEALPWMEHFFDQEEELKMEKSIKYAVFYDQLGNSWRVRAVPVGPNSFVLRKPLNPKWWGTRNEELCTLSGISDAVFCHGNGFIGGSKSREAAIAMAVASLAVEEEKLSVENSS